MRRWTSALLAALIAAAGIVTTRVADAAPHPQAPPTRASDRACRALGIVSFKAYRTGAAMVPVTDRSGCLWLAPAATAPAG